MCKKDEGEVFECKYCKTDKFEGAKAKDQLNQIVNHFWEQSPYQITCDSHEGEAVSYYCEKDRQMICDKCYIRDHTSIIIGAVNL